MAIKARDQVKWVESSKTLELEADTGEAFLVKNVIEQGATSGYITISINKTTVGYFRVDWSDLGSHLRFPMEDSDKVTILDYLYKQGIFKGYPVAEGETFLVSAPNNELIAVIYDIYEPGDISPDMENGSEATEYMLINYGRAASSGTLAEGDNVYDTSMLPAEFPEFPFGKDVPAKTRIDIYGILASDVANTTGSGANKQNTQYLKFIKEREVLFDEDKRGLPIMGVPASSDVLRVGTGFSVVGNYSSIDKRLPYMFSEPLSFNAGEELGIIVNTKVAAGSANIDVELAEVAVIEKIIKTG